MMDLDVSLAVLELLMAGAVPIHKVEILPVCLFVETADFSCLRKLVMTARLLILLFLFKIVNQLVKEAKLDGLAQEEQAQLLLLALLLVGTV